MDARSTWTPPAATNSSPSSAADGHWALRLPSWRTKSNRAAHRECPASSHSLARNLRPPSSPGSPGPMASPVEAGVCPDCGTPLSPFGRSWGARVCAAGATASPRQSWSRALLGVNGQPDCHPAGGGEAAHRPRDICAPPPDGACDGHGDEPENDEGWM